MPPLGKMILRRLLWVFPVAFGVVTMTFFMARSSVGRTIVVSQKITGVTFSQDPHARYVYLQPK
jgi:ABC-type dipeptide/oligopeptide/nickel transport system permease component